jgi:hypothetical protein
LALITAERIDTMVKYSLTVRDKPALVTTMMHALCGNAHISFEGDLSKCQLNDISGASGEETTVLKRQTFVPRGSSCPQEGVVVREDFVVIPLEPHTVRPILDRILPEGRIVHDVTHVQIEKNGEREFGAYDNFHPGCVVAGSGVPEALLRDLMSRGVLKSCEVIAVEDSGRPRVIGKIE